MTSNNAPTQRVPHNDDLEDGQSRRERVPSRKQGENSKFPLETAVGCTYLSILQINTFGNMKNKRLPRLEQL